MPYINVSTSAKIEDKKKVLDEISILVSSLTNKSKRFVMTKLDDNLDHVVSIFNTKRTHRKCEYLVIYINYI